MRKFIWAALVALCIFGATAYYFFTTVGSNYTSDLLDRLGARAEAGDHTGLAERLYRTALGLNPQDTDVRIRLTMLYEAGDRFSAAEALLVQGVQELPANPALYLELASFYSRNGMLAQAVSTLEHAPAGYVSLNINGKRPAVTAATASGRYNRPVSFDLPPRDGITYYYTMDGTVPGFSSPVYTEPFELTRDSIIRVVAVNDDGIPSRLTDFEYFFDKSDRQAWQEKPVCPHCGGEIED